jgi:hypothetical protein
LLKNRKEKTRLQETTWFYFGAQNKTRTCTPLRAPAPQAGVSTNFTTWAENQRAKIKDKRPKKNLEEEFFLVSCFFCLLSSSVPRTGLEPAHHY